MIKSNIAIENARIGFRNFSGKEGKFNPAGRRNFCVFLEEELSDMLLADGWNVRKLKPRDENEPEQGYLQVAVRYEDEPSKQRFNPNIVLITDHGKTVLNGDTVGVLDWAEIETVDIIIRPYNWSVNGKEGVKAYVKSMYVTIIQDEFEKKYYSVPDSATDTVGGCGNCETCDGSCSDDHKHV